LLGKNLLNAYSYLTLNKQANKQNQTGPIQLFNTYFVLIYNTKYIIIKVLCRFEKNLVLLA